MQDIEDDERRFLADVEALDARVNLLHFQS